MSVDGNAKNLDLRKNFKTRLINSLKSLQILGVLLLMVIFLSIAFPRFFTVLNLTNILKQQVQNLIVAVGITYVLISGEIDISIGGNLALVTVITGKSMLAFGILPGVLFGILVGTFVGMFNGFAVIKGRMPSFIVSLGMMYMTRSLAFVFTQGYSIAGIPNAFKQFYRSTLLGIPVPLIVVGVIYILAYVVLTKTSYGRYVFAVGDNVKTTYLMGINSQMVKFRNFVFLGFLVGVAGVILVSRIGSVQAETGRGFEFEVISAVIIGGCSLYGGQGNVLQSIIGVLIIALIRNGLNLSHTDLYWQEFVTGSVIIVAVFLDTLRMRMRGRESSISGLS